ncbi:MAG: glycosyltransferase family 4 protein [Deltaproteobacteria bacterium]|nr:glycosyltransferase family 4 protein [Deltaproteobacteria bacterium]
MKRHAGDGNGGQRAAQAIPSNLRVGYLGRVLPVLTETFVIREAAALKRLGLSIELFSIYPPDPACRHPEMPQAASLAHTIFQPGSIPFWAAHLRFLRDNPAGYAEILRGFVLRSRECGARRWRTAAHFVMAPHAAWLLKKHAVTHVHAHFANVAASVAMMAARLASISFSFTVHAYDLFVDDLLMNEKLRNAKFVVTCSRFNAEYLREGYPAGGAANIAVVHYGIDPDRFPVPRRCPSPPHIVLAVGRLVETKGFHTLIEACAILKERNFPIRCVLVGGGEKESCLRSLAAKRGVEPEVVFTGALEPTEMLEEYHRAHCLVMPSCVRGNDRDGMPNVLIEAMATGLPVIATRVSGIPELVRDGETGLMVEPDDPASLAQTMERLLRDAPLMERLGQAGRELVLAEFHIEGSARRLMELFAVSKRRR